MSLNMGGKTLSGTMYMLDVSSACLHLHSYPLSLSLRSGISIYMETVTLDSIPILEMFLGG